MKAKVLLTGASGFIGSQIFQDLKNDFEITALSSSTRSNEYTALNLLDENSCKNFFTENKFDVIIHAAAIAHGKNNVNTMSVEDANVFMTKNIFNHLDISETKVIYLSSVSVYSFKNNKDSISVKDKPIPVTKYGESKLICEEILQNKNPKSLHILRLAPVFSTDNLKDLGKRVFLPVFKTPFFTKQDRLYSLCHLNKVVDTVKDSINKNDNSLLIVKDEKDYSQQDLLTFFTINSPKIIINTNLIKPLLNVLGIFPLKKLDNIKEMLHKLFFSVRYTND